MKFHSIAGLPAKNLFDGGRATVADCRDMWGDNSTVIICRANNKTGTLKASVACGETREVNVGDRFEHWHTQNGRTQDFGEVVAVFRPGWHPKGDDAAKRMPVWVWK